MAKKKTTEQKEKSEVQSSNHELYQQLLSAARSGDNTAVLNLARSLAARTPTDE